jgi:hypothetical protein
MKLSEEAMGALMMCLQKCLLEQSDITPILKGLDFKSDEKGNLFVMNPPLIRFEEHIEPIETTPVLTDFSSMNVRDLRGVAKEVGITGYSKMKKKELLTKLQGTNF